MPEITYCHNSEGYYTHTEYCTVDPLESAAQGRDVFVLPADACLDAPVIAKGCVARRVNGVWVDVENHVGEKGFVNGVPFEIKEYGPLPDGWSITPPSPTIEDKLAAIEAEYFTKFTALDTSLLAALWAAGVNEVANRQALSAKRQQLTADKTAAITNVFLNG